MDEGEIRSELRRVDQRMEALRLSQEQEQQRLREHLSEYKEQVRDKLIEMQEIRDQIRAATSEAHASMDTRLSTLSTRISNVEQNAALLSGRLLGLGTGLTILVVVIELALRFLLGTK